MDDTHQGSMTPQLRAASYAWLSETYDEAESVPTPARQRRQACGTPLAAPRVFYAGLPDRGALLVAHGLPGGGMPRCVLVPSVRTAVRVRALRADTREVRDGTALGTTTHGDRHRRLNSLFRAIAKVGHADCCGLVVEHLLTG